VFIPFTWAHFPNNNHNVASAKILSEAYPGRLAAKELGVSQSTADKAAALVVVLVWGVVWEWRGEAGYVHETCEIGPRC
jgi:hypothetical protein